MTSLRVWLLIGLSLCLGVGNGLAHITPPVILTSNRAALVGMFGKVQKVFARDVRLSVSERDLLRQQWGWKPDEEVYRFYVHRDHQGNLLGAVIFLTQFTMHGPVRVAVGLQPDGKVKDAQVVELTEETFYWIKPLLDQGLPQVYIDQNSQDSFALSGRFEQASLGNMPRFYARIVASLIQRAAILYDVTFLRGVCLEYV